MSFVPTGHDCFEHSRNEQRPFCWVGRVGGSYKIIDLLNQVIEMREWTLRLQVELAGGSRSRYSRAALQASQTRCKPEMFDMSVQ
jgi:hypothetical protein